MPQSMNWKRAKKLGLTEEANPREREVGGWASSYVAKRSGPVRRLTRQEIAALGYKPPAR